MDIDKDAGDKGREFRERGDRLSRMPKSVRFLGRGPGEMASGMCEFEVVTGNAAYREGERFYLTPGEAQRVYRVADNA